MTDQISKQKLDNRAIKYYEKAAQKLDDLDMDLADMSALIEADKEAPDHNKSKIQGTYLERGECPFKLCGGKKAVTLHEGEFTPGTVMQCPCVKPEKLRDYINQKPKSIAEPDANTSNPPFKP